MLNFNNDSVFQAFGNNFLLNVHISSDDKKNSLQVAELLVFIKKFIELLPDYNLIFGGDFNGKFKLPDNQPLLQGLSLYPNKDEIKTVKKKRTWIQPQRNKADKLDESAKDYFASNLELR